MIALQVARPNLCPPIMVGAIQSLLPLISVTVPASDSSNNLDSPRHPISPNFNRKFKKRLTGKLSQSILYSLSQKTKARIGTLFSKGEKSPVIALVFLCPPKMQTALFRLKSTMVGCIGQSKDWPAPLPGSSNLIQSASQRLEPMRGGYRICKGATAMHNYGKNPTNHGQSIPQKNLSLRAHHISPDERIKRQERERGLKPLSLQADLLVKRVTEGGFSGQYLADAYLSAYTGQPFNESLYDLIKLDNEAFRLFHQILHLRFVSGWQEQVLYNVELRIRKVLTEQSCLSSTQGGYFS
jgi:hypothetical protein